MKEEIASGELSLVKTNLAKEVYSKLIADLDLKPKVPSLNWQQRIENVIIAPNKPKNAEWQVKYELEGYVWSCVIRLLLKKNPFLMTPGGVLPNWGDSRVLMPLYSDAVFCQPCGEDRKGFLIFLMNQVKS